MLNISLKIKTKTCTLQIQKGSCMKLKEQNKYKIRNAKHEGDNELKTE